MEFNTLMAVMGVGMTLGLLWYVRRVHREVQSIKREWYYHQQALKRIPQDIQYAVDPLKIQVSALAEGKAVSPGLVRSGRFYQDLSAQEAAELLNNPSTGPHIVLLDVRTANEFTKRRIPGALLIPVEQLDARFKTELPASARSILVYCEEGDRSRLACEFLGRQGLTNVSMMRGGLRSWPGPFEGEAIGGLIQISSKNRSSSNSLAI